MNITTVTIPNGTSTSTVINLVSGKDLTNAPIDPRALLVRIRVGAWTPADVSFETTVNGTDWDTMGDGAGNIYKIGLKANFSIPLNVEAFRGITQLRIRSGVPAAFVNQGAERVITLSLGV